MTNELMINSLSGYDFEDLISRLLIAMGLEVQETTRSADGGVDIFAVSDNEITGGKYIIQCKKLSSKVGEPVIRDLYGALHHQHASKGILITNSEFSRKAKEFAEEKPIELINGSKLQALLQKHGLLDSNKEQGQLVHFAPALVRLSKGFAEIGEKVSAQIKRSRLVKPHRQRRISDEDYFNLFAQDTTDSFNTLHLNILQIINDIGNQDFDTISNEYVNSIIELLSQTIDSFLELRHSLFRIRISSEINAVNQAIIRMFDSYLEQFMSYCRNVKQIDELNNTVINEDIDLNLEFSPTVDHEGNQIMQEISRVSSLYGL